MNGSSAAVCEIDSDKKQVKIKCIDNFSFFHNFATEKDGLRLSKACGVGKGKLTPWSELILEKQGPVVLAEVENHGFFATAPRTIKQNRSHSQSSSDNKEDMLCDCPDQGCCSEFTSSEELQDHAHLGEHSKREASESLSDGLRRDWAMKFSSLTLAALEATGKVKSEVCKMGWAPQKPRDCGTRFTEKVKEYLSSRFQTSERTGRKADTAQVAVEMRKTREADAVRKFITSEWLTKSQVHSYFSRLSAMKRRRAAKDQEQDANDDDDDESLIEEESGYLQHKARTKEVADAIFEIGLTHPILFDNYLRHVKEV